MRNSNWLVAAALAFVAAVAPGCRTGTSTQNVDATAQPVGETGTQDGAMAPRGGERKPAKVDNRVFLKSLPLPGVVEIFRGCELVGYASIDPEHADVSWWLLKVGVEPPVMPQSPEWLDQVSFCGLDVGKMNGEALCSHYGQVLLAEVQLWRLTRETPTHCQ